MSAFSRGLLLRLHAFKEPHSAGLFFKRNFPCRTLSTTSFLLFPTKTPNALKVAKRALPKANSKIPLKTPSITPSVSSTTNPSYALTLAQKPHNTLLYTAPSHTGFKIVSYTTGIFCFSWAYYHINTTFLHPPHDLSPWVPYAFCFISLGMVWFGTRMFLNPSKIIHNMTAIPKPNNQLQIEIVLRKMLPLPGFPARKLYVSPQDITIPAPMMRPMRTRLTKRELEDQQLQMKQEIEARWEYEKTNHRMTLPFRQMGRGFGALTKTFLRCFNRDGFMEMRVKGNILKLDCTGGWALDGGKAIDRLVKMEPHAKRWLR